MFISTLLVFSLSSTIFSLEQMNFGIVNPPTLWKFSCPQTKEMIVEPATNDQDLFSYECPSPSMPVEILPMEIDITFVCRLSSRLVWLIVDLYHSNGRTNPIYPHDVQVELKINDRILLTQSKSEISHFARRIVIINAFHLTFESIGPIADENIQVFIDVKPKNSKNHCEFFIEQISTWKSFLDDQCRSNRTRSVDFQRGFCYFYPNRSEIEENDLEDMKVMLEIGEERKIEKTNQTSLNTIFLVEENYRLILATLHRATVNWRLLRMAFIFLIVIFIILMTFFLYVVFCQNIFRHENSF